MVVVFAIALQPRAQEPQNVLEQVNTGLDQKAGLPKEQLRGRR